MTAPARPEGRRADPTTWKASDLTWWNALHLGDPAYHRSMANDRNSTQLLRWKKAHGETGSEHLAAALGHSPTEFHRRLETAGEKPLSSPPAWVHLLDRTLALGRMPLGGDEDFLVDYNDAGLLAPLVDLVRGHQRELHARVDGLVRAPRFAKLPRILASAWPVEELGSAAAKTLVLELNVARVEERLTGQTPEERYRDFLRSLQGNATQRALWNEYPVLLRFCDDLLRGWVESRIEFAARLLADAAEIEGALMNGKPLGDIESVDFGAGDTHRGGRSVAVLHFSGSRLVYKPRSLSADVSWEAAISWLNSQSSPFELKTPRVLDRGDYGWSTFVDRRSCPVEEAHGFYWRMGALLALNYALHGTDVHNENIIADGAFPVMIDLEALFHGARPGTLTDVLSDPAEQMVTQGVLGVGLLPSKLVIRNGGVAHSFDISAVSADEEQQSLIPVPRPQGSGTDMMHFVDEYVTMESTGQSRPRSDEAPLDPRDYEGPLIEGFEFAYRQLLARRDDWLAPGGLLEAFHHVELRHIARHTAFYSVLIADSCHPDFLRNGLDRDRFLSEIAAGADGRQPWEPLVGFEMADLRRGDVPYFASRPSSTDLIAGQERAPVRGYLAERPVDLTRVRIESLSLADMETQVMLISRAFDSLRPPRLDHPVEFVSPAEQPLDPGEALEEAVFLASELCDEAIRQGDGIGWIALQFVDESFWQVGAAPSDLYAGVSGIGLFLSQTAVLSGNSRLLETAEATTDLLARRAVETADLLTDPVQSRIVEKQVTAQANAGVFGPCGSLVYYLAHVGSLYGREDWLDAAEACLPALRLNVRHDTVFDLLTGSSGAILASLALHSVRPDSDALSIAEYAGAALLDRAVHDRNTTAWPTCMGPSPLTGVSHGAAGSAYALARLNSVSPRPEYLAAIEGALRHERAHLDRSEGNWPDLRYPEMGGTGGFGMSWCHGAPGIGLVRLALLNLDSSNAVRALSEEDVTIAEATTGSFHFRQQGFVSSGNSCLCHGDLGNLEFLSAVARHRGDIAAEERVRRAAAGLLARSRSDRWRTGPLDPGSVPGLMYGRAGIGYGLLRLANFNIPSVLLLEAP